MAEPPSTDPAFSNCVNRETAHQESIGGEEADRGQKNAVLTSKPPLSPVASHQPQLSRRISGSNTLPRAPQPNRNAVQIGAVASLAISGGLSGEDLLRLGQNRPPPVSVRSTRGANVSAKNGTLRIALRRGHHTAPPGTVQIGRVTRVARCDICLSPPNSGLCSFNSSPRGSPLHLTRVGGIATDTDRKSSLPLLPTDQLVRVGPGNVFSTKGQSYSRINWFPQPYKSTSTEASSPPPEIPTSRVSVDSTTSSKLPLLSDTDYLPAAPISPGGHSTSSDAQIGDQTHASCPTPATSEEGFHFFGSSYPTPSSVFAKPQTRVVTVDVGRLSPSADARLEAVHQQRLYQQHFARSVRNLRRYRHIYGDSLTSIPTPSKASSPPTEDDRNVAVRLTLPVQHRRCSADEALISVGSNGTEAAGSTREASFLPSDTSPKMTSAEQHQRRRRRLFVAHRADHNTTSQEQMVDVVVAETTHPDHTQSKLSWLRRGCFVHKGYIFLTPVAENAVTKCGTKVKPSLEPPSSCEGTWCYPLRRCELRWSQIGDTERQSVADCGLLLTNHLHPLCCSLRVSQDDRISLDYTCRLYFPQQDKPLDNLLVDLNAPSTEASGAEDGPGDTAKVAQTHFEGLANSGQGARGGGGGGGGGVAGPPGAFPLMVAAETLAASFGVHVSRGQAGGGVDAQGAPSKSSAASKKAASLKSGSGSTPLRQPTQDSPGQAPDVQTTHQKSSILRSTFARMRQVASGGQITGGAAAPTSSSSTASSPPFTTSTTSSSAGSPPLRSAFHQRLAHFSQTFTHDKPSPRRRKLHQIHRSYQSYQPPQSPDTGVEGGGTRSEVAELGDRKYTQLRLPLTAVLEPSNSFLQSLSDEIPVNANELAVTMPMQLAVVDTAMVAATGESASEEAVEFASMHQSLVSVEQTVSSNADSSTSSHSGKETVAQTSRRLLRRPTDPALSVELGSGDLQEAILMEPPILYPERSLVGSLPLHQCARSTFSAFVPFVVELCVTLVEKFGLNCVGIYRVSGNKLAHDFMAAELCKQLGEIDATNEKWNDIHALACVLKTLLRNLPDSLIPKVMYPDFLGASRLESWERRLLSLQRLLSIMECYPNHPEYRVHRATLRYLATHLARVASRQAVNRMTAYNLALVFAPNLIQSNEDSPELFIADSKFKIWLLETMIKYHKWVFSPDLGIESGCFVPEDSDNMLLTDEALAEVMAATTTSNTSQGLEFANQPGRSEGDVRPVLQEMLHAAALLPPPPSTSVLEVAEEPGPSTDRPTDVTTVVEQALESSAVELQEAQQQQQQQQLQQQQQRFRPVSQPGGEYRSRKQERSLSVGRRREGRQAAEAELPRHRIRVPPNTDPSDTPEK
uniref:Rho-GAP domain-containing protein n=1 Tax=Mesocestoides corti TaxID=53468 RepID=A0A5K3FL26_MESCO